MRIAMTQKKIRWAGQPKHVLDLATGLRKRGHEVLLISQPGSDFAARALDQGFRVSEIPMTSLPMQLAGTLKLARLLRRHRIEILHCHDARDHQMGCAAARLGGVRAVIRTKHNMLPLRNAASRWVSGTLTTHVISVSNAVKEVLIQSGLDPDHVTTVYSSIDPEILQRTGDLEALRRSLALPEGAPIIGTLGRLHRTKGIEDLVRAIPTILAGFPEARFLFVGSSYHWWPPLAQELGVADQCIFTGSVSNVADYFALMDVVVFPSLREAFGLAILEAMAASRPVVATRVGGVPESVQHEVNGLLVDPRSSPQIAAAVLRLLRDPELRRGLTHQGLKTATEVFSQQRFLEETERVYTRALQA